ncbi:MULTISPECIES: hypothetical protein [Hymenobacter]|uniref:Conjugal transfer protein TraK n=1 Tax=Hymenobacter guriensis TaxID=2793065 RepID=A0ABS0L854_9BACT|nr:MULTISPECIES: hypothetical protein [Hymenobacter]MBG8556316.1 hypothetical protein [Hymenobacter guriensis]MCR5890326.1 hypothetical protein [Hymenobacter sp. J193]
MDSIKDLNQTYTSMRLVALAAVALAILTILVAGSLVFHAYGIVGQRVYVVGNSGTTQMALADSPEDHTQYEMRNLVRTFALNMFGHDQYTFKNNLNTALPLIDDMGGRRLYDGFKKGAVLDNYIKFGARTTATVDSIVLDTNSLPVKGRLYIRQKAFIGDRQSKSLPMGMSFELTNTHRSNFNPFGIMITRFDYIPYNPEASEKEKRVLQAQKDRDDALLQQAKAEAEAAQKEAAQ